jgi:hypothetical protein
MTGYGTGKYGQSVYGELPAHPFLAQPGKVIWAVQVDWSRTGAFQDGLEPQSIRKMEFTRGRRERLRADGHGQAQPEKESFEIQIRESTARYDPLNESGPLYSYLSAPGIILRVMLLSTTTRASLEPVFYGVIEQVKYDRLSGVAIITGAGLSAWLETGAAGQLYTSCQSSSLGQWDAWFAPGTGTPFPVNHWKGRTDGLPLKECVRLILSGAGWGLGLYHYPALANEEQPDYFYLDGGTAWQQLKGLADAFAARLFFLRNGCLLVLDRKDGEGLGTAASAPARALQRFGIDRGNGLANLRNTIEVAVRPHHAALFVSPYPAADYLPAWSNAGPIAVPPGGSVEMDVEYRWAGQDLQGSFVRMNSDDPAEISPMAIWSSPDKTGTNMGSTGSGAVSCGVLSELAGPGAAVPYGNNQARTRIQLSNYDPSLTAYFFNVRVEVIGIMEPGSGGIVKYEHAASLALNGARVMRLSSPWIQSEIMAANIARAYGYALGSREAAAPATMVYQWSGQTLYDNLLMYEVGTHVYFGLPGWPQSDANFGLSGRWLVVGQALRWISADGQDALVTLTYEKDVDDQAPLLIPGLQVWLDAAYLSLVDGTAVSSWSDRSGNGNHAVQATPANQPVYQNGVAGRFKKPALKFDNSDDFMALTTILATSTNTFFIVFSRNATGATLNWLLSDTSASYTYQQDGNNWNDSAAAVLSELTQADNFYIRSCRSDVAAIKRRAGQDFSTARIGAEARFRYIGLAGSVCNCSIAELIIYDRILTDAEHEALIEYLKMKYGLNA